MTPTPQQIADEMTRLLVDDNDSPLDIIQAQAIQNLQAQAGKRQDKMQQQRVTHICTGCKRQAKLNPNKRQWCKCNPSAPFKMMVLTDWKLAQQVTAVYTMEKTS